MTGALPVVSCRNIGFGASRNVLPTIRAAGRLPAGPSGQEDGNLIIDVDGDRV